jgi:protease-4
MLSSTGEKVRYVLSVLLFLFLGWAAFLPGLHGRELPSSAWQHHLLSSSIAAEENGYGAMVNPALFYGGVYPRIQFYLEEDEEGKIPDEVDWGLVVNTGFLGFGLRSNVFYGDRVTDYTLAFSGGNRRNFMGISWNWSKSDNDALRPPSYLSLGSVFRPFRSLSIAGVSSVTTENEEGDPFFNGTVGFGFRPFGDRFTLWTDMGMNDREKIEDLDYHYGFEMEPLDGVVAGANMDRLGNPSFFLGINFSYGGISMQSFHDNDFERARRRYSYSIEGVKNRSILDPLYIKPSYVELELTGIAGYYQFLMIGQDIRLKETLEGLEKIYQDDRVEGVLIKIKDFSASYIMMEEIRTALADLAKTDRDVIVYWEGSGLGSYYLATAADCIVANPVTLMQTGGIGGESIFWKSALERFGVEYRQYNIGPWKGAGETFFNDRFSPEVKENVTQYLDDLYGYLTDSAASARGMEADEFRELYEGKILFTPEEMLTEGFIDTLLYEDQLEDFIKMRSDAGEHIHTYADYMRIPDRRYRWGKDPAVAVIYASGYIFDGESLGPFIIGDETLVEQFKEVRENDDISAVVLRVDSGGGSGFASDKILRAILETREKKPVIVSQGFLAGSGGYYISCPASRVIASPISLTGSIGVAAGYFLGNELFDSFTLNQDGILVGKNASITGATLYNPHLMMNSGAVGLSFGFLPFVAGKPLTEGQERTLQDALMEFYTQFVQKVADTRSMRWDDVHEVGEGRIWSGMRAKEYGLIDKLGGLETAIDEAKIAAGIPFDREVEVKEVYPRLNFLQQIVMAMMFSSASTQQEQTIMEKVSRKKFELLGNGRPHLCMNPDVLDLLQKGAQ